MPRPPLGVLLVLLAATSAAAAPLRGSASPTGAAKTAARPHPSPASATPLAARPVAPAAAPIRWIAHGQPIEIPESVFTMPRSGRSRLSDADDAGGSHWVFTAGGKRADAARTRRAAVAAIHEAYARAREYAANPPTPGGVRPQGPKPVEVWVDGSGNSFYTVLLDRPVGFEGGAAGRWRGNPVVYRVRMQIGGDGAIRTAVPYGVHPNLFTRYGEPRVLPPRTRITAPPAGLPPELAAYAKHVALGLPSDARADPSRPNDYLIVNPGGAVLSYNAELLAPNWVSWSTGPEDLGELDRNENFRDDGALPIGIARAAKADYVGSGLDKGHLMPAGDRTAVQKANADSFLMTNMMPESAVANRGAGVHLEHYAQEVVLKTGRRVHNIAGGIYAAGESQTIGSGVPVPIGKWRITVVPDRNGKATARSRVIATIIPNGLGEVLNTDGFAGFRTTPAEIERLTGLRFFSALPPKVAEALRHKVDRARIAPPAAPAFMSREEWRELVRADQRIRAARAAAAAAAATPTAAATAPN